MIAACLNMCCHFHPSIKLEEGLYGNAILSKHPTALIKTCELPTLPGRPDIEKRGALWVEMSILDRKVYVINAHLGLNRRERLVQSELLLGSDWIGNHSRISPLIFCADMNALPASRVYRRFREKLRDAQCAVDKANPKRTYPSVCPFARIDHVFVSEDVSIGAVLVPWTPLTRLASDHLPIVVRAQIP